MIVRRSGEGETLEVSHVDNDDLLAFERAVTAAGEHPEVVLEASYGWYWATDLLEELGCKVHLAHPLGNNWGNRRVKNDTRDAEDLADLSSSAASPRLGSPRRRFESSVSSLGTGPNSSACAPTASCRSTRFSPKKASASR